MHLYVHLKIQIYDILQYMCIYIQLAIYIHKLANPFKDMETSKEKKTDGLIRPLQVIPRSARDPAFLPFAVRPVSVGLFRSDAVILVMLFSG